MATNVIFGTASTSQFAVGTSVVLLDDIIKADSNYDKLKVCNVWTIGIETSDIRSFSNGNVPTSTLGAPLLSGQLIQVTGGAKDIRFIRDTGAAVDATVTIEGAKASPNFPN